MMSTRRKIHPAAFRICFLSFLLLLTAGVQGQVTPTSVSNEVTPTRQFGSSEEIWGGSGMASHTPDFPSRQDFLPLSVLQTSLVTPSLPLHAVSSTLLPFPSDSKVISADHQETPASAFWDVSRRTGTPRIGVSSSFALYETLNPSSHLSSYYHLSSTFSDDGRIFLESDMITTSAPSSSISYNAPNFTTCTSFCNNERYSTSAHSKVQSTGFLSSTSLEIPLHTTAPNTLGLSSSLGVPSTSAPVLQTTYRASETSELPQTVTVLNSTAVTTVPVTLISESGVNATPLVVEATVISTAKVTTTPMTVEESGSSTHSLKTTLPIDEDVREVHYTLFLRTKDCPFNFAEELQKELLENTFRSTNYSAARWNVMVERCASHLNVSIRVKGSTAFDSLITRLNTLNRSNISVNVLNRTFYIVHVQRHENFVTKNISFDSNSTITIVSKNEFSAYVTVGVTFGLVLFICITVCCVKFCVKRPRKPLGTSRSSQMHLRFEDYTLTPIPRPSSLYVDYYRGSIIGDHYSTTSAGSITSTPTVEQGVVQPFDTCIVPLEDSETMNEDTIKKPIVEAAAVASVPKLGNNPNLNPVLSQCINTKSESKERLHPKYQKAGEFKNSGLANPIFQRY